jgi:lipooligosaccharide transport system ATP-binding protein
MVRVLGLDPWRDGRRLRPRVGVMLQSGGVYPAVKAGEMLRHIARLHAHPLDVGLLVERLGLTGCAGTPYRRLSGGEQQRLSLAMAVVGRPELVFLDEPTAGLDPQARHATWDLIGDLRLAGVTVVLTTHFMDEAERLCSRLLVLDHGKKIAEGKPRELIAQHLEPDVVEVYGAGALALAQAADHAALRALASRVEVSGETVFFYTQDARALMDRLASHGQLRTLHRPANLEDLFLKLTGRQIREDG